MADDLILAGPWPIGIDNRQDASLLPKDAVSDAINVDFDTQGFAHRRAGYTKAAPGVMLHSGWDGAQGAFIVNAGDLCRVSSSLVMTPIYRGIAGPVTYCEIGGTVYASDGYVGLAIRNGVATRWSEDPQPPDDDTLDVLPPCSILRYYRGRMYSVSGQFVHYTEPPSYAHTRPATNWFAMTADITVFEPVKNGIWVVSDQTRFLSGAGPGQFNVVEAHAATAAAGTACTLVKGFGPEKTDGVIWYSDVGPVLGTDSGQLVELTSKHVTPHVATSGVGVVREIDGQRHFIASLYSPEVPAAGVRSWFD